MMPEPLDYASSKRPKGATAAIVMGQLGLGFGCLLIVFGLIMFGLLMAAPGMSDEPGAPGSWRDGVRIGGPLFALGLVLYILGARSYRIGRRRQRTLSS